MAEESKAPGRKKKVDLKKVDQSTKKVQFLCEKDHKLMKKGVTYSVSLNIAEILDAKGLGKIAK